jgi:hypothetical protein
MKVAYLFATPLAHYVLSRMIVPQLESGTHGAEVVGMFFLWDNVLLLAKGNPLGKKLSKVSRKKKIILIACDQCAYERNVANDLVGGAKIGCFPDLYEKLEKVGVDQVITI